MTNRPAVLTITPIMHRMRRVFWGALWVLMLAGLPVSAETNFLTQRAWFESRSMHFHIYSCGATQAVARVAARLEQFQDAYTLLTGTPVASPPIVVMAFPDHATLQPFLPLYQGKPANLAAFFLRGSDENLIVLSLAEEGGGAMETVFHEYTHLLLRHNQRFWPIWLNEGMAEVYSTFELVGTRAVRIGYPIQHHLVRLTHTPMMPLQTLFEAGPNSAEYNESDRQGIFYAQSWLLTHYLMLGPVPGYRSRLGYLTTLLRQGHPITQAFTNAFQTSLAGMEAQLRAYLAEGRFAPLEMPMPASADLTGPRALTTRALYPVEIPFRLGDELLRIDRLSAAEKYFTQAQSMAPASPLPYEGMGLLAIERKQHEAAVKYLQQALEHGSASYLARYSYASEKFRLTCPSPDTYVKVDKNVAAEIRAELEKSLELMPDFGPAHHLLGFFELVQQEDLASAEQHLARAIQLEPENLGYHLSLAQTQMARNDLQAARHTLEGLRLPYVDSHLRDAAQELLNKMK